MGTLTYPFSLTAGQPENVNQLNANLAAISTLLNGNVDAANLTDNSISLIKLATAVQDLLVPTGSLLATGRASVPSSQWLMCDGASYLRATYPALFTAISTTYGSVDGTHFNVPDLQGRVPVGVDGPAARLTANDALGQSAGFELHTLSIAELPSHNHSPNYSDGGSGAPGSGDATNRVFRAVPATGITSFQGGGGAHNNMQPYQIVNWMIKV